MKIRLYRVGENEALPASLIAAQIDAAIHRAGFQARVITTGAQAVSVENVRINPTMRPRNVGGFLTPKRVPYLCWEDWVEVNGLINDVLDHHGAVAKVETLMGQFLIRDRDGRKGEADWEELKHKPVGNGKTRFTIYRPYGE
jgi:hypothetical protein